MGVVSLIDFTALAHAYEMELGEEGIPLDTPISAAAVLADLARLAGVPTPWFLDIGDTPVPYPVAHQNL